MPRLPRPSLPVLPMPAMLAAMEPAQRHLTLAVAASLALHGVLLTVHFTPPDLLDKARERALDVILVNSKSATRPTRAQAKAQTNLDGGGNTERDIRATTPLPPSAADKPGDSLVEAQRRVAELEAEQQKMMTRLKSERAVSADDQRNAPTPQAAPKLSGLDLASSAMAIARLEGEIARQTQDYNQRPRKKTFGARVEEYRFAQYIEDWRLKIERIGNLNYPDAARGRLYGSLVLSVAIKSSGELASVDVLRPSGQKVLDEAALRIVRLAAPYAVFPDNVRRDTDVIEIVRTWTFTSGDRLNTSER